ncbi:putative signal peptide protein [Puccinia sorghi]|uniref:Putative signal peptide protein n=1 Tax=Puccinia sorghi TaxID=27349 RepID=A0A0L6VKA8_9BASI|nr:putative signal peptide protein [Puccinia sorghi]
MWSLNVSLAGACCMSTAGSLGQFFLQCMSVGLLLQASFMMRLTGWSDILEILATSTCFLLFSSTQVLTQNATQKCTSQNRVSFLSMHSIIKTNHLLPLLGCNNHVHCGRDHGELYFKIWTWLCLFTSSRYDQVLLTWSYIGHDNFCVQEQPGGISCVDIRICERLMPPITRIACDRRQLRCYTSAKSGFAPPAALLTPKLHILWCWQGMLGPFSSSVSSSLREISSSKSISFRRQPEASQLFWWFSHNQLMPKDYKTCTSHQGLIPEDYKHNFGNHTEMSNSACNNYQTQSEGNVHTLPCSVQRGPFVPHDTMSLALATGQNSCTSKDALKGPQAAKSGFMINFSAYHDLETCFLQENSTSLLLNLSTTHHHTPQPPSNHTNITTSHKNGKSCVVDYLFIKKNQILIPDTMDPQNSMANTPLADVDLALCPCSLESPKIMWPIPPLLPWTWPRINVAQLGLRRSKHASQKLKWRLTVRRWLAWPHGCFCFNTSQLSEQSELGVMEPSNKNTPIIQEDFENQRPTRQWFLLRLARSLIQLNVCYLCFKGKCDPPDPLLSLSWMQGDKSERKVNWEKMRRTYGDFLLELGVNQINFRLNKEDTIQHRYQEDKSVDQDLHQGYFYVAIMFISMRKRKRIEMKTKVCQPTLQKKLAQMPEVDMQKVPGSFCCYSNHAPKVIQPSFDAQSLCRLHTWLEHAACQLHAILEGQPNILSFSSSDDEPLPLPLSPKPVFKSSKAIVLSFCLCVFLNDREETPLPAAEDLHPSVQFSVPNHNMLYIIKLISPLGYYSKHRNCIIAKGFIYLGGGFIVDCGGNQLNLGPSSPKIRLNLCTNYNQHTTVRIMLIIYRQILVIRPIRNRIINNFRAGVVFFARAGVVFFLRDGVMFFARAGAGFFVRAGVNGPLRANFIICTSGTNSGDEECEMSECCCFGMTSGLRMMVGIFQGFLMRNLTTPHVCRRFLKRFGLSTENKTKLREVM